MSATESPTHFEQVSAKLYAKGLYLSEYRTRLLLSLHHFCLDEGVGVEYLLFLLLQPSRIIEEHGTLPQRFARTLRLQLEGTSEVSDGVVKPSFLRDVGLYVQAVSKLPEYGRRMPLAAPDDSCNVGMLDARVPLRGTQSAGGFLQYLVRQLQSRGLLAAGESLQANTQFTAGEGDTGVLSFSVHVFSTAMAQAAVVDALRRSARQSLPGVCSQGDRLHCESMAGMRGSWEGVFAEDEAAAGVTLPPATGPVLTLFYQPQTGAFVPSGEDPDCIKPIRTYREHICEMVQQWHRRT